MVLIRLADSSVENGVLRKYRLDAVTVEQYYYTRAPESRPSPNLERVD